MNHDQAPEGVVFHAGFPNASEDASSLALSLDKLVIQHKASTFFWRLDYAGIPELGWKGGDVVVVDRALSPRHGDWLVAVVGEEFVVRHLSKAGQQLKFIKPNGELETDELTSWGVITHVLQTVRRPS